MLLTDPNLPLWSLFGGHGLVFPADDVFDWLYMVEVVQILGIIQITLFGSLLHACFLLMQIPVFFSFAFIRVHRICFLNALPLGNHKIILTCKICNPQPFVLSLLKCDLVWRSLLRLIKVSARKLCSWPVCVLSTSLFE